MTKGELSHEFTEEDRAAVAAYPNADAVWPQLKSLGFEYAETPEEFYQQLVLKDYTLRVFWKPLFYPPRWQFSVMKIDQITSPLCTNFLIETENSEQRIIKLLEYIRGIIE